MYVQGGSKLLSTRKFFSFNIICLGLEATQVFMTTKSYALHHFHAVDLAVLMSVCHMLVRIIPEIDRTQSLVLIVYLIIYRTSTSTVRVQS